MKSIILIVSVFFAFSQAEPSQELMDLGAKFETSYKKCVAKNNVTITALFESLRKVQFPLDKNIQCTFACIGKEFEIVKSDNTLDKTKVENVIKPILDDLKKQSNQELIKKANEVIDTCLSLQKGNTDECAAANKLVECAIENCKKNGLIPESF